VPGWLYHHLTVVGPAEALVFFVEAARGAGVVPWRHDPARVEEDVLTLALAQSPERRNLSAAGCRILARQLRAALEAHQTKAAARGGQGASCPFDLHALLPVPDALLARGPGDPQALAWMRQHWGVTAGLRHPVLRPGAIAGRRLPPGYGVAGWGFFTDGGTPHAAIAQFALRWPALRFDLQPRPMD
jgi:hypothetical protein